MKSECATFFQQGPEPDKVVGSIKEGASKQMKDKTKGNWHFFQPQCHSTHILMCCDRPLSSSLFWSATDLDLTQQDLRLFASACSRVCSLRAWSACVFTLLTFPDKALQAAGMILGLSIHPTPTGTAETFDGASGGFRFSSALVNKQKRQRSLFWPPQLALRRWSCI